MLWFRNDYSEGCHPQVLAALERTNMEKTPGYGDDIYCAEAAATIRALCSAPNAAVHFMSGGTQANKTAIGAFLRPYESVIAAVSAHIYGHECGSIEHNGHQILTYPAPDGKVTPDMVRAAVSTHTAEYSTTPRLVYISNTTEVGTVYSAAELRALSEVCRENSLILYCDGARLGAAMAAGDTDFADYAATCDAFTIGGTKNGLLFGEALVITSPALDLYFRNCMKQQGAILAKGRLFGVQYCAILKDGLYMELAHRTYTLAAKLTAGLKAQGYTFLADSPSNQVFPIVDNSKLGALAGKCAYEVIEPAGEGRSCIRFVTSWATTEEDVDALLEVMAAL